MASPVDEVLSCMRTVGPADLVDEAVATTRIADVLDSFARVLLVPVLEERMQIQLEQADLAPQHWETVGALAARAEWIRAGRNA